MKWNSKGLGVVLVGVGLAIIASLILTMPAASGAPKNQSGGGQVIDLTPENRCDFERSDLRMGPGGHECLPGSVGVRGG